MSNSKRGHSATIVAGEGEAEYPHLAMWTVDGRDVEQEGLRAAELPSRQFLMVPLNEVVDERYSVYVCRLPKALEPAEAPAFCHV